MSYPLILYHSGLSDGTLTATSTAAGYHADNVLTWTDPWNRWKAGGTGTINLTVDHGAGNTQTCDTLAITTHNLDACGGSLVVGQSDDGAAWTDGTILTSGDQMTRTYGRTVVLDVSGVSGMGSAHRYHRIQFNTTTVAVYAGAVALGRKLSLTEYLPAGFDPFALDVKAHAPYSRGGLPLPAAVESVKQIVKLKGPKGGLASAFSHDATHSKMGVTSPNWREFVEEVWSQGMHFWVGYDIGAQAYRQGWLAWTKRNDDLRSMVVTPSGTGSRRSIELDVLVYAEGMAA